MPESRQVRFVSAKILTAIGWIEGTFALPMLHAFTDHLEHAGPFLRVLRVRMPGRKDVVPTFVVQRNAVILMIPDDPEHLQEIGPHVGTTKDHAVTCLMEHGVVHGKLRIVANVKIGDFLLHHSGFVVLKDCVIHLRGQARPSAPVPWVVVNAHHVIGVSEEAEAAAPAKRTR